MPLFPYLPVIVWMGMIQVVLGATGDITDASELTMNHTGNLGALDAY
jgi:hypothetical protein